MVIYGLLKSMGDFLSFNDPVFIPELGGVQRFIDLASSVQPSGHRPAIGGQGLSESSRRIINPTVNRYNNNIEAATANTIL